MGVSPTPRGGYKPGGAVYGQAGMEAVRNSSPFASKKVIIGAVAAVAARCKKAGVPLIALVGSAGPGADALLGCGVTKLLEVTPDGCPPPDRAAALYRAAADRFFCALAAEKRR